MPGIDITADAHATFAVALADLNGDGHLDLIAGNLAQPSRLYLNNGTATPFAGVAGTDIGSLTNRTRSIVVADFNGDGHLDVVLGCEGVNLLFLNNGTGAPFQGVAGASVSADADLTLSLAAGDVNGDGHVDLIAGNHGPNRLYLNNGTGDPFAGVTGTNLSNLSLATRAVALADVDGDGDLDLVVGNISDQPNQLFLNNGTPAPFAGVAPITLTSDNSFTRALAVGDVDGDGDPDVVAGNDSRVSRLYLNPASGNPFVGMAGVNISAEELNSSALAVGDVTGDGRADLVIGNAGQPNRLYRNNGTADPFAGVSGTNLTDAAENTSAVALGDFNGDGRLDLVAGNLNQTNRLYLNNGTAHPFHNVGPITLGSTPRDIRDFAVGDLNGDGRLDLVAANFNQRNQLFLNNGTATPFEGVEPLDLTTDAHRSWAVALGDVNGDGHLDVVVANDGQPNRLYLNNGTANPFAGVTGLDISGDLNATRAITLGDVNGDGRLDVVTGEFNARNRLYLNNGTANPFAGVTGIDIGTDTELSFDIRLVDVDGDGDLDLVVANQNQVNRLYLNNGAADPFAGATGIALSAATHATRAVAASDLTGNGAPDLVFANFGQPNVLFRHRGIPLAVTGLIASDIGTATDATTAVALGDLNGDGFPDLAVANSGQLSRVYLNDRGTNHFTAAGSTAISIHTNNARAVVLGDFNRNGRLDLLLGNFGAPNRLYTNNGTAAPFAGVGGMDFATDTLPTTALAVGDFNGDGRLDVAVGNENQPSRLYLHNGTAQPFDGVAGLPIGTDVRVVFALAAGDVDGDGRLDLVLGNIGQPNRLHLNSGAASPFSFSGIDITSDADATVAVALGDVNGDGRLDVVAGNFNQPNRLYLNNGTTNPFAGVTGVNITADAQPTRAIALVDFNRDGRLDVLAINDGVPARLYLNNGSASPFAGVSGIELPGDTPDAIAVAVADVDGDGRLDFVTGHFGGVNRLHRRRLFDTSRDLAASLELDNTLANIPSAVLTPAATAPNHTAVDYFLSNNGGANFFQVRPGAEFVFPNAGNDLRWRVRLRSLTPARSPRLDGLTVTAFSPIFAWRTNFFSAAELADPFLEATVWGDLADPDLDGMNNYFEFIAGVVPTDPQSRFHFRIEKVPGQPTHRRLVFSPRRPDRDYVVEFRTVVQSGPFQPVTGAVVSDEGEVRAVTDVTAGTTNRFYRVGIFYAP